jgi:hypothetical protein
LILFTAYHQSAFSFDRQSTSASYGYDMVTGSMLGHAGPPPPPAYLSAPPADPFISIPSVGSLSTDGTKAYPNAEVKPYIGNDRPNCAAPNASSSAQQIQK